MKINILDAHDRYKYLIEDQSANVFKGAEDCLKINPFSLAIQEKSPYIYLFAHPRTAEDGVNKILFWDPRLSIPAAQTNSYLFRAISHTDLIETCWMLPPREMWNQYKKGNVTENNWVLWSIAQFQNDRKVLERPHPDDMPEEKGRMILKNIIDDHRNSLSNKKLMDRLYKESKPETLVEF